MTSQSQYSDLAPSVNPPWWTRADEAEWAALLSQFVYTVYGHPWDNDTRTAFTRLMEWHRIRDRLSMAEWMRAHE